MLKYILITIIVFSSIGIIQAKKNYTPISNQINIKTMDISGYNYLYKNWSVCNGNCTNHSSSSGGGK